MAGLKFLDFQNTIHLADLTVDGEKTLYAVWTAAKIVTVTFNPNGHGTTSIDYVNVDKGQSTQKPGNPTADKGYEFIPRLVGLRLKMEKKSMSPVHLTLKIMI